MNLKEIRSDLSRETSQDGSADFSKVLLGIFATLKD